MAGLLRVYYALIIRRIDLSRTRRQGPVGEGPAGLRAWGICRLKILGYLCVAVGMLDVRLQGRWIVVSNGCEIPILRNWR